MARSKIEALFEAEKRLGRAQLLAFFALDFGSRACGNIPAPPVTASTPIGLGNQRAGELARTRRSAAGDIDMYLPIEDRKALVQSASTVGGAKLGNMLELSILLLGATGGGGGAWAWMKKNLTGCQDEMRKFLKTLISTDEEVTHENLERAETTKQMTDIFRSYESQQKEEFKRQLEGKSSEEATKIYSNAVTNLNRKQAEIQSLQQNITQLTTLFNQCKLANDKLKKEQKVCSDNLKLYQNTTTTLQNRIVEVQAEKDIFEKQLNTSQNVITLSQKLIEKNKQDTSSLKSEVDRLNQENTALTEQNRDLQTQYEEQEFEYEKLQEQNNELIKKNSELQKTYEILEKHHKNFVERCEKRTNALNNEKMKIAEAIAKACANKASNDTEKLRIYKELETLFTKMDDEQPMEDE